MKITDAYKKYDIPPHLALHQLTVAAVAKNVCVFVNSTETDDIVAACLLHDMGNIIKFKLGTQIPGLELDNIEHWKAVQQHFFETYGKDEHHATMMIAQELGVGDRVLLVLDAIGFPQTSDTLASHDEAKMIANYSDMRVAPHGVATLEKRIEDLRHRYGVSPEGDNYQNALRAMEVQIFKKTDNRPDNITALSVAEDIRALEMFEI